MRDFSLPGSVLAGMASGALITHAGRIALLASLHALWAGPPANAGHAFIHFLFHAGLAGLFLVSIVDSSFVPLPVPGLTDIMLVLYAAQHENPLLLIAIATFGSALGGLFSHKVGHSGGLAFIEKRVSPRIFKRVTRWMESHAVLAVALPAMLPPPMPLSPFVLAAGALNMSRKTFMITFTASRCARHAFAVWLGVHYGGSVLQLWHRFSTTWGTTILVVVWTLILFSVGFALWQIWKTSHRVGATRKEGRPVSPAAAS